MVVIAIVAIAELCVCARAAAIYLSLGTGKQSEESNLLQQLADACLVVDALEPSVREELVQNFCSRELTSYQQIFEGADISRVAVCFLWNAGGS
ncbi:hypothetical protein ACSBR1_040097 [Camellia fascicularis]